MSQLEHRLQGDVAAQFDGARRQAEVAYARYEECRERWAAAVRAHMTAKPGKFGSTGLVALEAFESLVVAVNDLKACAQNHVGVLTRDVMLYRKELFLRTRFDNDNPHVVLNDAYPETEREVREFAGQWCVELRAWGITPPEFDCSSYRAALTTLAAFGV